MINLKSVVAAVDTRAAADILKRELEKLDGLTLPLQQGLSRSSFTDGSDFGVTVLGLHREQHTLRARIGIFYKGIVAGCNCADDPTPVAEIDEYCEVELLINSEDGNASARLLSDCE